MTSRHMWTFSISSCLYVCPTRLQMLYDDFQTDVEDRARKAGVRVSGLCRVACSCLCPARCPGPGAGAMAGPRRASVPSASGTPAYLHAVRCLPLCAAGPLSPHQVCCAVCRVQVRLQKTLTELEKQFYGSSMAYDKAMAGGETLEKVGKALCCSWVEGWGSGLFRGLLRGAGCAVPSGV